MFKVEPEKYSRLRLLESLQELYLSVEMLKAGYPKERARELRLSALSQSLKFLVKIGVEYVVFEDLFVIKRSRGFIKNKSANRMISKFAKKQMLIHG